MGLLDRWRQRGWQEISREDYQRAYSQYGGSVITHPQIISSLSSSIEVPIEFWGKFEANELIAAAPTWGSHIAGNKRKLKQLGKYEEVDLGNMEVILPVAANVKNIQMGFKGAFIAHLHEGQIKGLRKQRETISVFSGYQSARFSKKFLYNRKRELRLLEEIGCQVRDLKEFSPGQIADWYIQLFERRWHKKPKAFQVIARQFSVLWEHMLGKVLFVNDQPIAVQLLILAESPQWLSLEYLNAGVDVSFQKYSPGSVLTYLNTQMLSDLALAKHKALRYSFGRTDADYKSLWCETLPVFNL